MVLELLSEDIGLIVRWEKGLKQYAPVTVESIVPSVEPKIVIADFSTVAKEVLRFLKKRDGDNVSLIVLEGAPTVERAKALLASGVKGYGNAYMQAVHLQSCVETVKSGNIWVYPEFVYAMVEALGKESGERAGEAELPDSLTPREKEIVTLILEGMSNREMAETLGISERTVKAHLGSIYGKLHVSNRLELAMKINTSHRTFVQ